MNLFSGLIKDVHTRFPHYKSDFIDIFDSKVISASIFLFFACLANAVAFGSLSSLLTHGQIGVIEMLIATAIGGIIYALLSAQPITLLGGTGPIVIFTSLLFAICQKYEFNFLVAYAWCGLWAGVMLVIFSIINASNLMRYLSSFTDDIFAALVSIIFIIEALDNIFRGYSFPTWDDGTGWVSVYFSFSMCILAWIFYVPAKYLDNRRRLYQILADFSPSLSIFLLAVASFIILDHPLEGPDLPGLMYETSSGRDWFIDISQSKDGIQYLMIIPGLFAAVLLYLDQNITSHIINESGAPLRKGHGYHLDLFLIGIMIIVFSLFGLPWIVAATVHSVNHLKSLSANDPTNNKIKISVIETRVSALMIHIAIAAALFGLSWLELIPMPVLFGLFIFMGLVSLNGNQFFARSMALVVPFMMELPQKTKLHKKTTRWRAYTCVQLICFLVLWFVKSSFLGILFPLFIAACIPVRLIMKKFFSASDLSRLDNLKKNDKGNV